MLVLSRRDDEAVVIRTPSGEMIRIVVMERFKGKTRIGFQANPDISILREEVDFDPENMRMRRGDR